MLLAAPLLHPYHTWSHAPLIDYFRAQPSSSARCGGQGAPRTTRGTSPTTTKSLDCFDKLAVTNNGESPGPTIHATQPQGDTVVVTVHNSLETENTGRPPLARHPPDRLGVGRWHRRRHAVPHPAWRHLHLQVCRGQGKQLSMHACIVSSSCLVLTTYIK